mgnify:CR=1 FL=1
MKQVAAAIIYNNKNEILICQRQAGGSCSELWEFPGGKVEKGESQEEAVIRELEEELSIKAVVLKKLCTIEDNTKDIPLIVTAYACQILEGKIQLSVHSHGTWLLPSAIDLRTFHTSDEPIIRALIDFMTAE